MKVVDEVYLREAYDVYKNTSLQNAANYLCEKHGVSLSLPCLTKKFKALGLQVYTRRERLHGNKLKRVLQIAPAMIEELSAGALQKDVALKYGITEVTLRDYIKNYNKINTEDEVLQ